MRASHTSEDAAPDMAPRATYYSDDGYLRFMATVNHANPPTPSAGSRNTSPSRCLDGGAWQRVQHVESDD